MPPNTPSPSEARDTPPRVDVPAGLTRARLGAELRHHAPLLVLTLGYSAAALAYLATHGIVGLPVFSEYLVAAVVPLAALVLFRVLGEVAHHALHVRPFRVGNIARALRHSEIFAPDRAAAALVPIILIPLFSSVFTSFKVSIPEMQPFSWDPVFMRWDAVVHGGVHPWEWLQPVLGHPAVTSAISYLYNIWQGMMLIVYWQIVRVGERELRMRFLLAFVLAWAVLGSALALAWSSAGPCYYGDVVDGPDPYAEQMAYLNAAHERYKNWSIIAQDYLWTIHEDGRAHLGGGISAMPSLHVAVALLLVFLGAAYGRKAAWLAGAYLGVILVGSVHLGWHYAVDGYAGLLGGWLAWLAAGWLVRRVVPPPPGASPLPQPAKR